MQTVEMVSNEDASAHANVCLNYCKLSEKKNNFKKMKQKRAEWKKS